MYVFLLLSVAIIIAKINVSMEATQTTKVSVQTRQMEPKLAEVTQSCQDFFTSPHERSEVIKVPAPTPPERLIQREPSTSRSA